MDVHRDSLVATIINEPSKETRRLVNDVDGINSMKEWLNEHECRRVAMESSGIYWVPLYLTLEEASLDALLANAHQVKGVPEQSRYGAGWVKKIPTREFSIDKFVYDKVSDTFVYPAGKRLGLLIWIMPMKRG